MQGFIKKLIILSSFLLILSPTAAVYARDGSSSNSDDTSQSSEVENETESEQQKNLMEREQELAKRQAEMQREAQKKLNERAKEFEQERTERHNDQEKKKTCEDRKNGLEQKLANIRKNAQKHQDKITSFLDKAIKYKDDNNITDKPVADAILAATDAKAKSAASVAALESLSPTIDCTSGTVASDVAKFKAAAEQARNDLRSYKKSVRTVLEAIEAVKEPSSEGDQQ